MKTLRAAALALLIPALASAAPAAPSSSGSNDRKADYRVYLLVRDPAKPWNVPDRADPQYGLAQDLKREIENMGGKVEKSGSFDSPTASGPARGNEITVFRASWTKAEYDKAAALAKDMDLFELKILPVGARMTDARGGAPASAADLVAQRVQKQLKIAVPSSLLKGEGRAFDGSTARDGVVDDYTRAAASLGVPLKSLPRDPAALARLLSSRQAAAPAAGFKTADVPSPAPGGALKYDAYVEKAAAERGVDPDVLRALIFASQGYGPGLGRGSGLHGPMGLSLATGRDYGLDARSIEDPAANIAAGAAYLKDLQRMFGGNMSRAAAAFYCGSGAVRRSRGIPSDCAAYVSQFYLAYQNGAAWAVDRNAPRLRRPTTPAEPVSRTKAVEQAAREDAVAAVKGDTPPNRPWHSRIMPEGLISKIVAAATRNLFDSKVSVDPDVLVGLSWAEGGYSSGNKRPNEWGAVGPMQVTYSGAQPHCRQPDARGRNVFDWRSISKWDDSKNVECGAKVFYDRVQWTKDHDPIIGLALYNTQQKHWDRIIGRNKVPPFPETVAYVVRAATIACARSGKMLLKPEHFENQAAIRLAKAEERRLVRSEFPYEGNEVPPQCQIF